MINAAEAKAIVGTAMAIKTCGELFEQAIVDAINIGKESIDIPNSKMPKYGVEAFKELGYRVEEIKGIISTDHRSGVDSYGIKSYKISWGRKEKKR